MKFGIHHAIPVLASAVLATMASHAGAATTCSYVPSSATSASFVIAVASNFYEPAKAFAQDFLSNSGTTATSVQVCADSTGNLKKQINGTDPMPGAVGSNKYSLLLAADADTPAYFDTGAGSSYKQTGASAFLYAYGIPVLYSEKVAKANLVQNATPPYGATATGYANPIKVNQTYVTKVAVGNPSLAPYGVAAEDILVDMNQWVTPTDLGTSYTSNCSTTWSCMYSNIDYTLQAIQYASNNIKAGFVSKAQMCTNSISSTYYVEFPDYQTTQKGILINSTNAGQNTYGANLVSFMNTKKAADSDSDSISDWNEFLISHCYKSI